MAGAWEAEDGSGNILFNDLTDYFEMEDRPQEVMWWDGTSLRYTNLRGWWDGTVERPVLLKGYWNGSSIDPIVQ